jgi:hypothetical protein
MYGMGDKFYVVVKEKNNKAYPFIELDKNHANGYCMFKTKENAMKRLQSAALTEQGTKFYLVEAVAEAYSPVDLVVKEY